MFQPKAEVIADSINETGDRLTTFVLTYHRYIHSEVMTYRNLSRSSASSRAIPVEKMIKLVESQKVYPLHWGENQRGMVAENEVTPEKIESARIVWEYACMDAVKHAHTLAKLGIHKQVVNRLLEPFSTITVICTGTSWGNLFEQRCHPDAQPEFKALADLMKAEYESSHPTLLEAGQWHLPLCDIENRGDWYRQYLNSGYKTEGDILNQIKVCVGRCARVSYLNHDGDRSLSDDIKLHDRLLTAKPAHLSPFEHVAIALPNSEKRANFTGFEAYRHHLEVTK